MKKNITVLAARNNALWCDAVCRAHDRPGEFHDTLWLTRLGAPRFYPDAVTLSGVESASAQMETIGALVGSTREREWAVKDSFQSLELNSLGFERLFDAEFHIRTALVHAASAGGHECRFRLYQGDGAIIGGGIINRGAEVVGLSNLFGSALDMVYRTLAAKAGEIFPRLPLVGYERGHELAAAHQAGFETVGFLRVWSLRAGAP